MGYADHDPHQPAAPGRDYIALFNQLLGSVVRIVGCVLLAIGLWISALVVLEAWSLYLDPSRIEPFARALEQGTRMDALVQSLSAPDANGVERPGIGVSYLIAWFVVPILLFTAGYLAMTAARVGGQLALNANSRK